jgi:pyrimidine-nucleoside phosphorylase
LVDKHSTGGVGDKVSLVLAPLLACLGFRVPMISGRGLGITGGTLDKLESIPGFRVALTRDQIVKQVHEVGCVICSATDDMVPADRTLYALRDVTGTVPSIPLMTASILSKKLAEGISALVLDVKFGSAAFMNKIENARELAQQMVGLANDCGVKTRALLTDMATPTGRAVGNWLEVKEAIACLEGKGPADLRDLVVELAAHIVMLANGGTAGAARAAAARCLEPPREPNVKFAAMIAAQGADVVKVFRKAFEDTTAPHVSDVKADRDGYISRCDARVIGEVVRDLGGGRMQKDSRINHDVGVDCLKKPGERISTGDALCRIHAATAEAVKQAAQTVQTAFAISDEPPTLSPLIAELVA